MAQNFATMTKTLKGLLLFAMTMLFACSDGGEDIPKAESKPEPEPEKPSLTISSTSDTTPVFDADGGEVTISFTASEAWSVSVTNNRADSWISVSPTNGEKGEASITIATTPNDSYDERNATITIECGEASESIVVSQKQLDALIVSSNKCEVNADGGVFDVEIKSNINYKVEVKDDWIKKVESRGLSTTTLEFSVEKNPTDDIREGEIVISSGAFTEVIKVYQGYHDFITLTQREFDIPSDGGILDIEIKSTVDYEMTILKGEDWISEDMSRAASTHTHHIIVSPNETYDVREAQIVFADKQNTTLADTVTIRQAYKDAILVADTEYLMEIGGGALDFKVQATIDFDISIDVDWIKQAESRGLTEHSLFFDVEPNEADKGREGTITIKEKDGNLTQVILVKQKGWDDIPYLTFTAEAEQTFTMNNLESIILLEYSVGGGEWMELGTNAITFGGSYGSLRLRGISWYGTAFDNWSNYSTISFGNETKVSCTGDIRTLVGYGAYATNPMENIRFCNLFKDCTCLISAPELPSTTLSDCCYSGMFSGCTGLVEAPELPATTLSEGCYSCMFLGCTGLTEMPELPATTLANNCYGGMFSGCTGLAEIPELPAIILADYCYSSMFCGCTGLVEAPELPATTLSEGCYSDMFRGCTNLTAAPQLPAMALADNCYNYMFYECTNIISAPELPATILARGCYSGMFYGCTGLIKAPELPATTLANNCYVGMFSGCAGLVEAPKLLPATILKESCYSSMFYECVSLISAPIISAMSLEYNCCSHMFLGCTNLINAPELPATLLAESCYSYMFFGCINLISVPKILPATTLSESCYSSMFHGCTSLTYAPELPSITLSDGCYNCMFLGCTSLLEAPRLPATTLSESCYSGMFDGCTALTSTPELPATTLVESCYSNMFWGCSNLNKVTMLATDINARDCLNNWLLCVAPKGVFIKAPSMTSLPEGVSGIPVGWEVNDYDSIEEDNNIHMGGWTEEEEL